MTVQSERDRAIDDQRVMTKHQCAEVNGISIWTLERQIKAGKGPVLTRISDRRIGVTVGNNRRWQQSRERKVLKKLPDAGEDKTGHNDDSGPISSAGPSTEEKPDAGEE